LAYLCSMDGQLHAERCCGDVGGHVQGAFGAKVTRRACCEAQRYEASAPPATHDHDKQRLNASFVALAAPPRAEPRAPTLLSWRLRRDARGPPAGLGPPLFIRNCSYLI
jgi:hypothetical protein